MTSLTEEKRQAEDVALRQTPLYKEMRKLLASGDRFGARLALSEELSRVAKIGFLVHADVRAAEKEKSPLPLLLDRRTGT